MAANHIHAQRCPRPEEASDFSRPISHAERFELIQVEVVCDGLKLSAAYFAGFESHLERNRASESAHIIEFRNIQATVDACFVSRFLLSASRMHFCQSSLKTKINSKATTRTRPTVTPDHSPLKPR